MKVSVPVIKKNEQLEREYNKLKHRHSLLHDECLTVEHAKEGLEKDVLALERENAQLIQGNEKLKKYNKYGRYSHRPYFNFLYFKGQVFLHSSFYFSIFNHYSSTALILRTPADEDCSFTIRNLPSSPVLFA